MTKYLATYQRPGGHCRIHRLIEAIDHEEAWITARALHLTPPLAFVSVEKAVEAAPDFLVEPAGFQSGWTLTPQSYRASTWLDEHCPQTVPWLGGSAWLEPGACAELLMAIEDAGFTVEEIA